MRDSPRGAARVGPICMIPALLREGGVDPAPVFEAARFDSRLLDDPENFVAYCDLGRLLAAASAALNRPHLGLAIAERCGLAQLGHVAELAAQAPNVGVALEDFVTHLPMFDRGSVVSLVADKESATFSFMIVEPDVPAAEIIREGSVAIMAHVLRDLCGADWEPDLVMLPHRARGPLAPYLKYFRAPVNFNAAMAGFAFGARWLDRPVAKADPIFRDALRLKAAAQPIENGSFADLVRREIQRAMPAGLAEAAIARSLDLDASTLRRRLANEGASFRAIVQDIRYLLARQLIGESELSLAEVAAVLGFGELSVFSRAFRRWSGMAPSQWRKEAPEPKVRRTTAICLHNARNSQIARQALRLCSAPAASHYVNPQTLNSRINRDGGPSCRSVGSSFRFRGFWFLASFPPRRRRRRVQSAARTPPRRSTGATCRRRPSPSKAKSN
jgi:AraC-like DNA-binding protein